jgi:G3E family GTPase
MQKIPFHIISGFLGSGKTTFLNKIIDDYSEKYKLGIIQNEFAPANIDGAILKKTEKDFDLLEINNGSVFCVCLLGDFVRSLEKFIDKYHPDILIIEASGLSDTTSISEVLSSGSLGEKLFLASNWCIVDARNYSKTGLMKQRVNQQIKMADEVIINKNDLTTGNIGDLENEIRKINPYARIRETTYCSVDFEPLKTAGAKFYFDSPTPMNRPEINSMVLKTGRKPDRESFENFLRKWAPKSFRIKGFVNTKDKKTLAVQCTFDSIELKEIDTWPGPTELIALTDKFSLREWNSAFRAIV